jgi:surface antigen
MLARLWATTSELVMRSSAYRGLLAAGMAAALFLMALSHAAPVKAQERGPCAPCLEPVPPRAAQRLGHDSMLDEDDEIATLEAIRVALTEVSDGASYVWHRRYGQLGGLVQPTQSFKDPGGRVCRHIIVILSAGLRSGRFEGTACRIAEGRWLLDG